jgi:hypothetical protein
MTLDFVLKGALERYLEQARSVRATLTEEQHQQLEPLGRETFASIFTNSNAGNASQTEGPATDKSGVH